MIVPGPGSRIQTTGVCRVYHIPKSPLGCAPPCRYGTAVMTNGTWVRTAPTNECQGSSDVCFGQVRFDFAIVLFIVWLLHIYVIRKTCDRTNTHIPAIWILGVGLHPGHDSWVQAIMCFSCTFAHDVSQHNACMCNATAGKDSYMPHSSRSFGLIQKSQAYGCYSSIHIHTAVLKYLAFGFDRISIILDPVY